MGNPTTTPILVNFHYHGTQQPFGWNPPSSACSVVDGSMPMLDGMKLTEAHAPTDGGDKDEAMTTVKSNNNSSSSISKKKKKKSKKKANNNTNNSTLTKVIIGDMETYTRDPRWTTYRRTTATAKRATTNSSKTVGKKTKKAPSKASNATTKSNNKNKTNTNTKSNSKTVAHKKSNTVTKKARKRRLRAFKKEVTALDACFQNLNVASHRPTQDEEGIESI